MNEPTPRTDPVTPRHLWVVGVLALLWNSIGAFDYVMTETRNASYMSAFTPEQLEYFYAFPAWAVAAWATGVWGGVLGSILLLFKRRWAAPVFAVSLAAMLIAFFHNYVLSDGYRIMGGVGALAFTAVIVVIGIALLIYSTRMSRRGVLI